MKKVIVTGGAGYIGSHVVVELHAAGYTPILVDNFSNSTPDVVQRVAGIIGAPVQAHQVDCNDGVALAQVFRAHAPIFGAIHFAAFKAVGESVREPTKYYRNNVGSLVTLLDVMRAAEVSNLVFSSSCTVYGQPEILPVTEGTPMLPAESPYGRSKQICEDLINDVVASGRHQSGHSLQAVTLRYFNPIGAHASARIGELPLGPPENLVPYITQTAAGLREKLTVFGDDYDTADGTCVRDYIHVVDLARAHVRALEWLLARRDTGEAAQGVNEVFNLGTGRGASVMEVIRTFEEVSGQKLNYVIGQRRPGDVVQTYAAVDKAQTRLGWRAEMSLGAALRDAWAWQQALPKR